MKTLLAAIVLASSLPLLAVEIQEVGSKYNVPDLSDYDKEVAAVVLCARDLVQKEYEGSTRRVAAGIILTQLHEAYAAQADVALIGTDCKNFKKMPAGDYQFTLDQTETKPDAKSSRIIDALANPTTTCTGPYIQAAAGWMIAPSIGFKGQVCTRTDGKKWAQFTTGVGVMMAAGAAATAGYAKNQPVKDMAFGSVSAQSSDTVALGIALSNSQKEVDLDHLSDVDGAGVGGMISVGGGSADLGIKVMPLPSNKKILVELLKN